MSHPWQTAQPRRPHHRPRNSSSPGEYYHYDDPTGTDYVTASGRHHAELQRPGSNNRYDENGHNNRRAISFPSSTKLPILPPKGSLAMPWEPYSSENTLQNNQFVFIGPQQEPPMVILDAVTHHGRHAWVRKVSIDPANKVCALKLYPAVSPKIRDTFESEIKNLRKMEHRHVARFFAAYKRQKLNQTIEYGILMQPWASSGTLEDLLKRCQLKPTMIDARDKQILKTAFGCIASVVEYLHRGKMRHKDLKPENILVHHDKILLTDFGSSVDGSATQSMTTHSNEPSGYTTRYAAPEYKHGPSRNEKSDIFAMGCIFYDIISTLAFEILSCDEPYHQKLHDIRKRLPREGDSGDIDERLKRIVYHMLSPNAGERPSAGRVVRSLSWHYFCQTCNNERGISGAVTPAESQTGTQRDVAHAGGAAKETVESQASTGSPSRIAKEKFGIFWDDMTEEKLDFVMSGLQERARQTGFPPLPGLRPDQRAAILRDRQYLETFVKQLKKWSLAIEAARQKSVDDIEDEDDDESEEDDEGEEEE